MKNFDEETNNNNNNMIISNDKISTNINRKYTFSEINSQSSVKSKENLMKKNKTNNKITYNISVNDDKNDKLQFNSMEQMQELKLLSEQKQTLKSFLFRKMKDKAYSTKNINFNSEEVNHTNGKRNSTKSILKNTLHKLKENEFNNYNNLLKGRKNSFHHTTKINSSMTGHLKKSIKFSPVQQKKDVRIIKSLNLLKNIENNYKDDKKTDPDKQIITTTKENISNPNTASNLLDNENNNKKRFNLESKSNKSSDKDILLLRDNINKNNIESNIQKKLILSPSKFINKQPSINSLDFSKNQSGSLNIDQ
jgi:hypothetical protein